jgi:hypothetical protein
MPTDPTWVEAHPEVESASDRVLRSYTGDGTPIGHFSSGFETDGYIEEKHILKPEFYGRPSPRMEAVSSQIHHRRTAGGHRSAVVFTPSTTGGSWEAIPHTAARIKIRDSAYVYVTSSFFCYELGGVQYSKSIDGDKDFDDANQSDYGGQSQLAGTVGLAIHGKEGWLSDVLGSTKRYIYTNLIEPRATPRDGDGLLANHGRLLFHMLGRHQHNIVKRIYLKPGVYDIGLAFNCNSDPGTLQSKSSIASDDNLGWGVVRQSNAVFFKAKNMVIDVQYVGRLRGSEAGLEEWRYANTFDDQRI